jgi:hypothetical protein
MYSLIKAGAVFAYKFFSFFILKYQQLLSNFPDLGSSQTVDSAITATFDCFWVPLPDLIKTASVDS